MIVGDTSGASTANRRIIPYRRAPRPIYPFDPGELQPGGIFKRGLVLSFLSLFAVCLT